MSSPRRARWICDPAFDGLAPLNLLHRATTEPEPEADERHPAHLRNRHMLVRKAFQLDRAPATARLRITADDYYKLYVNGRFVGQGPAQAPASRYYLNEWDLTPYLGAGRNVIAADVYYQGLVNRAYNSGDLRQGLLAELRTEAGVILGTDESWQCRIAEQYGPTTTTGYQTQYLEHIDQRRVIADWATGTDDTDWAPVSVRDDLGHVLVDQPTPPLAVHPEAPTSIRALDDRRLLVDFGHEVTGQVRMSAQGSAGEVVVLRCGEELLADGSGVRFDLRCNCRYEETWTLSGGHDVLDQYEYKAFRYLEVDAAPGTVDPASIRAVVRHHPTGEDPIVFETEDPMLARIWEICVRGVQLCAQENFVDCPSREKGQYLGDNTVMGHVHPYLTGDSRLVRKALAEFAATAEFCPGLLAVTPGHLMQEIADYSLQWPRQVLTHHRWSGDMAFLQEMVGVADSIVAHFDTFARDDGLLADVTDKWNLVDWPDGARDGYDFELTQPVGPGCHNVINAFWYGCVQAVQQIKDLLGIPYQDRLADLRAAFVAAFGQPDGQFVDAEGSQHRSLHANALPLYFGLTPPEAVPAVVAMIRRKRLSCGVYFSYFVLNALVEHGETELALELIRGDDPNSWATMVNGGASTCWEAWDLDAKWNTSLCHGWASAPIQVLVEGIVGLRPGEPGWRTTSFEPHIPVGMAPFRLEVPTPAGRLEVRYDGTTARLGRSRPGRSQTVSTSSAGNCPVTM